MLRLARDLGYPSRRALLRNLGSSDITEWLAFYLLEASDANPELTQWDDAQSIKRKLEARAAQTAGAEHKLRR